MVKASIDTIELVTDAVEANRVALHLLNQSVVIGLDCEWVKEGRVALLQLAVFDGTSELTKCFVFRLTHFSINDAPNLARLLNSNDHLKVGVGIMGDMRRLRADYGLSASHFIDLRHMTRNTRIEPGGLASLVRQMLGRKLDKNWQIQTSNWEADELSEEQLVYAADDALAGLQVYAAFHTTHSSSSSIIEHLTKEHVNADYKQTKKQPKQTKTGDHHAKQQKQKKTVETRIDRKHYLVRDVIYKSISLSRSIVVV